MFTRVRSYQREPGTWYILLPAALMLPLIRQFGSGGVEAGAGVRLA